MVESIGAEQYPGTRVDIVCPRCSYLIANFTADELRREPTKRNGIAR